MVMYMHLFILLFTEPVGYVEQSLHTPLSTLDLYNILPRNCVKYLLLWLQKILNLD